MADDSFGHSTYLADMRAVLATIFNETLTGGAWNDWEEVNAAEVLVPAETRGGRMSRRTILPMQLGTRWVFE